MMSRILLLLPLLLGACALPTERSARPRGVDLGVTAGQDDWRTGDEFGGNGRSTDWSISVNIHWDLEYADEYVDE